MFYSQMLPFLVEVIRGLPLITFPLIYFAGGSEEWVAIGVAIFVVFLGMFLVFAVMRTGSKNPTRLEMVSR